MTNLHRSPPMNQSKTDLGIVNESQLPRHGISLEFIRNFVFRDHLSPILFRVQRQRPQPVESRGLGHSVI